MGRGQGSPRPGTDAADYGQLVPAGGCGVSKLSCWALPGTVRARGLHCWFCINMAVSGAHGGPGGGRRAGRPRSSPARRAPAQPPSPPLTWLARDGPWQGVDRRAGRAAGLPGGLWPWSRSPRPGSGGVKGQGRCRGPQRCRTSWLHGRLCYPEECAPRRRGGGGSGPRSPAPPGARGGAGRGGGRRAGGGCGGGARTALFATDACARCWRISHFSKAGLQARRAPPSLRPLPARLRASGARLPSLSPASRLPQGRQRWISGALSFIRKLLTKWKVNYGCPGDPALAESGCPLPDRGSPVFCPTSHAQPLWSPKAAPGSVPAKGSALVLHDDLGCGKRKRWREARGWERDYDTPQLHFYLQTFSKVFLAGHAFRFIDEQDLALFISPAPLDNDEETDLN